MARRGAAKARDKCAHIGARPELTKAPSSKGKKVAANDNLLERLAAAERERDTLRVELDRFKARHRQLEETHAQVRDRIAWALDALRNILDGKC